MRSAAAQQSEHGSTATDQLRQSTLGAMAFALATSEIALQRAENPVVRTFAQLETEEQQAFTIARQMNNLPLPGPSYMDAQKQQMLQQLQALSGGQFDQMYIQGQTLGHQELLQLFTSLSRTPSMPAEQMLGIVGVPAIRSHLAMLQGIQQQMRG